MSTPLIADLPYPKPITTDVASLPLEQIGTITRQHVEYLDNRFSQIERLTSYLQSIDSPEGRKALYISHVRTALYDENLDVQAYTSWYEGEYFQTRSNVDRLCDRIISEDVTSSPEKLVAFGVD